MRALNRSIPILLLLLTASVAAAVPRDEPEPAHFRSVRYEVHHLNIHAAEALAWEQCPAAVKERCQVAALSTHGVTFMDVNADSATHERIVQALVKADSVPPTQVFQAVLLAASNRPGAAMPDLPPGAQKALADIRGLLPFKSYEQLDGTLLRTTEDAEGHLVGHDGRQYRIRLSFEPAGAPGSGELFVERFQLLEEMSFPAAKTTDKAPRTPRDLISTSFGLKRGETIVVGTSKSDAGDEALVLLLTAAQ
ncbi:MAG TPA: hypothetical protein VH988_06590 [Thermoanaerobaculia bacterium]|jgi:hypothetical protein|nr:hypothetical protein [Thermoanaerobaculia bacterium]